MLGICTILQFVIGKNTKPHTENIFFNGDEVRLQPSHLTDDF